MIKRRTLTVGPAPRARERKKEKKKVSFFVSFVCCYSNVFEDKLKKKKKSVNYEISALFFELSSRSVYSSSPPQPEEKSGVARSHISIGG